MTKVLHFVKLRTLCSHDNERLLLELPQNPLKVTIPIDPSQPGFTAEYLASFRKPIAVEDSTTFLQDKTTSGWLAWDKELHGYRQAGWDERPFVWDPSSAEAVAVMATFVRDPAWWTKLVARYSQEDNRKVRPCLLDRFSSGPSLIPCSLPPPPPHQYLSGDAINFIKSLCQIFSDEPFQMVRAEVDALLAEADPDRHKQRAIAEIISGLVRGMKHWNGKARQAFWDWLTPCVACSLRLPPSWTSPDPLVLAPPQPAAQDRHHHEARHAQGVDDVLRVQLYARAGPASLSPPAVAADSSLPSLPALLQSTSATRAGCSRSSTTSSRAPSRSTSRSASPSRVRPRVPRRLARSNAG